MMRHFIKYYIDAIIFSTTLFLDIKIMLTLIKRTVKVMRIFFNTEALEFLQLNSPPNFLVVHKKNPP